MDPTIIMISNVTFSLLFGILVVFFGFAIVPFFKRGKYRLSGTPPVSIIIPAYNEEKNIGKTLKAIFSSDYPKDKMEVMVVDDGSNDNTIDIAKSFDVKVLKQNHNGKVGALNYGIKNASNELIITIDADTILKKDAVKKVLSPFSDKNMGAVGGAMKIECPKNLLSFFQNIEYVSMSLVKEGFSQLFNTSLGFYGSFCCYRKSVLQKIGGFQDSTTSEDIDVSLQIRKAGYKSLVLGSAVGSTPAEDKIKVFFKQRTRWSKGMLQVLVKHKDMFASPKYGLALSFIMFVHMFWYVYAFFALPLLFYQFFFWLPYNIATLLDAGFYVLRWFSMIGPFYTLYMIPEWGFNIYSVTAVLAGIITAVIIAIGLKSFNEKIQYKTIVSIFFYFPYTILLCIGTMLGVIKYIASGGRGTFIDK
ncbi:MAG: glycosyltransferase family 2 protein [Candidatus Aenigmarchaeota archaeon]|nr:glycosyltransferase family 2 protein [Candidatus Aenigmarchaeota archaeon]